MRRAALAGRHVIDREPAAGPEHAAHLVIEPVALGDVHGGVLRPNHVEALVLEGHVERIPLAIGDPVTKPGALRQHARQCAELRRQIEPDHRAGVGVRQKARGPADAGADVEHAVRALEPQQLRKIHRRSTAAGVELVDRREIVGRQPLDILPCRRERRQDRLGDPGVDVGHTVSTVEPVVLRDCRSRCACAASFSG